jgi:hypothetical protein
MSLIPPDGPGHLLVNPRCHAVRRHSAPVSTAAPHTMADLPDRPNSISPSPSARSPLTITSRLRSSRSSGAFPSRRQPVAEAAPWARNTTSCQRASRRMRPSACACGEALDQVTQSLPGVVDVCAAEDLQRTGEPGVFPCPVDEFDEEPGEPLPRIRVVHGTFRGVDQTGEEFDRDRVQPPTSRAPLTRLGSPEWSSPWTAAHDTSRRA